MAVKDWYKPINSASGIFVTYRYISAVLLLALRGGLSLVASAIVWKWERESLQADFQRRRDNPAATLSGKRGSGEEVFQLAQ